MGLGTHHGPNTRPLLPLLGRARGSSPPACITSPPLGCLSCSAAARHALSDGLDARVFRLTNPLPGRYAFGAGLRPRMP